MRLSRKGRYGVRAMVALAMESDGSPVSIRRIAAGESIPVPFLQQLFLRLRKAGLVKSVRGPGGGFTLTKAPERVRVLDILEAVGEGVDLSECATGEGDGGKCGLVNQCASRLLWQKLEDTVRSVLGGTTLAELCKKKKGLRLKK